MGYGFDLARHFSGNSKEVFPSRLNATCGFRMFTPHTWILITHLGNSVVLLSTAVIMAVWLLKGRASLAAVSWLLILGIAVFLVLLTKLAFLGWGIGIESIDFTGISGHAMLSSAVFPTMAGLLAFNQRPVIRVPAIASGFVVALVVGISRLVLDAHSESEVLIGWTLGSSVALVTLFLIRRVATNFDSRTSPVPLALALALILATTAPREGQAGPETHGLIVKMALWASGRSTPFDRNMLHHQAS
jgi:membrane-associated phospholipid phosphatase